MQERANTLSCSMLKIREGKIILFTLLEQEPNAIVFSWNDLRMSHSDNIHSYDSRSIIAILVRVVFPVVALVKKVVRKTHSSSSGNLQSTIGEFFDAVTLWVLALSIREMYSESSNNRCSHNVSLEVKHSHFSILFICTSTIATTKLSISSQTNKHFLFFAEKRRTPRWGDVRLCVDGISVQERATW